MAESRPPQVESQFSEARVSVEHIGGIDNCSVTLEPGVTVLTGRNATNRTSFLTAIADVLGGPSAALKSDAESGRIELELDDTIYTKEYSRREGTLVSQGTQFTDETELVELFAQVLEDNPARRAVERGDDLRDLIMRPVDTAEIERDIRELKRERTRLENQLDEIEERRATLPDLEERRQSLEDEIAETADRIEEVRETIDAYEAAEEETERAEELLEELEERRQTLREVERRITDRESEIERLETNLAEVEQALEAEDVPEDELEAVETRLEERSRRRRELAESIEDLRRIVEFNETLLEGDAGGPLSTRSDGDVTAALDPGTETVTCWTCGTDVERDAISGRLDELRDIVSERRATERELESEIEELGERQNELERQRDRTREMENQRDRLEEQLVFQREEVEDLRERREDLREELDAIQERVDETEELRESDLVDAYARLSDLEYERGQQENELERVTEEIDEIEGLADEREDLEARREELSTELSRLRSRIDDLEADAIEQFNTHVGSILELLEYGNLTRVWIERLRPDGHEGESTFELHIVRRMDGDTVYEDVVDNLSESEREVIGLVVALAGYLVHDVHEAVPFMLLDSLEAIDSERIAALIDYYREYVPFLVVALLPEDASAIDESYARIPANEL